MPVISNRSPAFSLGHFLIMRRRLCTDVALPTAIRYATRLISSCMRYEMSPLHASSSTHVGEGVRICFLMYGDGSANKATSNESI